jgi:thiosulfate/3-mercaptopyruvate sulfurtransferase
MPAYPIIPVEELVKNLGDPMLRIIDCRFMLQDVHWGENSFNVAHIPGAGYANLNKDLSSNIGPNTGRHPLPTEKDFVDFIQRSGISIENHVVAYDDASGSMAAARMWWLLRAYGFINVQVMNGSYSDWVKAGLPITADKSNYPRGTFQGILNHDWVVEAETVDEARSDKNKILIDARSHDRFLGQNEIIDPVAGHIPGAYNRPLLDNLNPDNKLKSPKKLRGDFLALIGKRRIEDVILYCGSGVTASFNHLAMETAGLHGAKIYPGSWSEWITDPSHKIAIG